MTRFPRTSRVGGWTVGLGLLAALAHGEPSDVSSLQARYAGQWRFSGGSSERAAVPAAVERSVDGMFFISRGIAYDRLMRVCDVCSSYTLSFARGEVSVAGPCQLPDISPQDGSEVDHRTQAGDESKLSQRFLDGALVQYFRGEEGARRVVWTLQPDEVNLAVHITITSKHLPHPVDYTLSYQRVSPKPDAGPADAGQRPAD